MLIARPPNCLCFFPTILLPYFYLFIYFFFTLFMLLYKFLTRSSIPSIPRIGYLPFSILVRLVPFFFFSFRRFFSPCALVRQRTTELWNSSKKRVSLEVGLYWTEKEFRWDEAVVRKRATDNRWRAGWLPMQIGIGLQECGKVALDFAKIRGQWERIYVLRDKSVFLLFSLLETSYEKILFRMFDPLFHIESPRCRLYHQC